MREENVVTHEQLAFGCVGANLAGVWLPLPQLWRSMVDHNLTGVALSQLSLVARRHPSRDLGWNPATYQIQVFLVDISAENLADT